MTQPTNPADSVDMQRAMEARAVPDEDLRRLLQRVFLDSPEGQMAFAFIIFRYSGEGAIHSERQRHEHNVVADLKNLIGWGHTLPSIRAQIESMANNQKLLSLEDFDDGEANRDD